MKPRVIVRCVASHYEAPYERIIEFSFPDHPGRDGGPMGGLISFRGGKGLVPRVQAYRVSRGVKVTVRKET
jgi:hypothetical protein